MVLDYRQVAAVNARLELDLRIGAAFTRFQTMTLQRQIEMIGTEKKLISYGIRSTFFCHPLIVRILSISNVRIRGRPVATSGAFRPRTILVD